MGAFHTVTLPDGRSVDFPSTMGDAEINAAVQKIAGGGSQVPHGMTTSFSATGEPIPIEIAQRHARASIRPGETVEQRYGTQQPGEPGGAKEALYNLAGGVGGAVKEVLFPEGKTEWDKWKDIGNKLVTQPLMGETEKAKQTTGMESAGHTLASYVPFLGPMAAQTGESLGRKDYGGATVQGIATGLGARGVGELDEGLKGNITEAGKAIQRHLAIDQGKVRVVNDMVRQPLAKLDAAVSNEIGRSVQQAVSADELDMQTKGTKTGMVDVSKASAKARDVIGLTAKEMSNQGDTLVSRGESQPTMTLRDAKSYTTDVGRMASAAKRAGNAREAAALDALYNGLHEATADRAKDLGQSKMWQHYIDETRNYKNMQGGLLGELIDEPVHAKALNKLVDPARATEASEISKALDKYGIDPATFDKAKQLGIDLNRYSQETKANFMGKIRAIIKHPIMAGGAAVGASAVGSASGIPGMGLVLPIIVAGKVANMLDAASLKSLLNEITKSTPPEAGQVNPPLEGPIKGGTSPVSPPSNPAGSSTLESAKATMDEQLKPWTQRLGEKRVALQKTMDDPNASAAAKTEAEAQMRKLGGQRVKDVGPAAGKPDLRATSTETDISGMLKDQYGFTNAATKNLLQSIRGKYSGLDEGLKMAIAEAIKRTKGAKAH